MTASELRTENGIATDELFSPGYVRFDCTVWGLPDNTTGQAGWHCVYRPLAEGFGYEGHELVTPAMRAAVREHYAVRRAAEDAEEAAREAAALAALLERKPVGSARAERAFDALYNEGGDGYNPYRR